MVIEAGVGAGPDVGSPESARRRRPSRAVVAALAGLLLVAASGAVWAGLRAAAFDGVRVAYDAQPMICDGAEVGTMPSTSDPTFLQTAVELVPGMRCELRVQVINQGSTTVTVTTVGLVGAGEHNPLALEPAFVNPNGQDRLPDDGAAVFDITGGIEVPAGTIATFTAIIDYPGGAQMVPCSAQGMNLPVVTVTARGASRDLQPPAESVVWFLAGTFVDDCG